MDYIDSLFGPDPQSSAPPARRGAARSGGFSFDDALKAEGATGTLAELARSVYQQESGSGANARTSNAGAEGGMQVIPSTFRSVADAGWDRSDPTHNARAGIRYLQQMLDVADGDPALAAAGYYGGPGAIGKARRGLSVSDPRNPGAPNTLEYGQQVAGRMGRTPRAADAAPSKPVDYADSLFGEDSSETRNIMRGYVEPASAKPTKRSFASDVYEVGRQVGAGAAVDLPRMVGQGLRWLGDEDVGRPIVEAANARAPGWEPDLEGRGIIAETLIKGGRAVAPLVPAIATSLLPGGQFIAPTVAAGLFGTSSAQDTEDKLRKQGIPDSEATAAGWRTGAIQGPLEGVSMAAGGLAVKPLSKVLGLAGKTTGGVAGALTDTAIIRPLAKGLGLNLLVQPATEVAQDVGTELNERSYGAKPEDAWDIAKDSAQGAIGLTLLLGPFAGGAHVQRSRQAAKLKEALYSPNSDPMVQAQARDMVAAVAKEQGVAEGDIDGWLDARFREDDALVAQAAQGEQDGIQTKAQGLFDAAPAARAAQNEQDRLDITNQSRLDAINQMTVAEPPQSMTGTSASSLLGPRSNPLQDAIGQRAVQDAAQQQAPTAVPLTPEQEVEQQKTEELRARVAQENANVVAQKADAKAKKARAAEVNLEGKGAKVHNLLAELDALKAEESITEAEFNDSVVNLARPGGFVEVQNMLKEKFGLADTSTPPVKTAPITAKETPVAPVAPVVPAKVEPTVTTETKSDGTKTRVFAVKPDKPIAPVADKPGFRESNRAANTKIAALRAERKKLVAVGKDEADVGNYGDLDRNSPEGQRVAQIDNEINAALPPVADIRAHVESILSDTSKTRNQQLQGRLSAVTGITLGENGLEQEGTPTPMAEVARREKVSREAISKQLRNAGLSDLHIGRLVANDMAQGDAETSQAYDASNDEDADRTSGYEEVTEKSIDDESSRISSSAAKAMGDGIVEVGGRAMTPEEKAAEREATALLKRVAKTEDAPTASDLEFAEKRRKLAEEETLGRMGPWLESSDGENAIKDWNTNRSEVIPAFADLPLAQQLDWLKTIFKLNDRQLLDINYIKTLQQTQERSIDANPPSAENADVSLVEAGAGQDSEVGRGSGTDQAGPPAAVTVKKKRVVAAPSEQGPVAVDVPTSKGTLKIADSQAVIDKLDKKIENLKALLACLK
jgi:hypothetical protein